MAMERKRYMDDRDNFWQYPLDKCTRCGQTDTSTIDRRNRKGAKIVEVHCNNCNTVVKTRVRNG